MTAQPRNPIRVSFEFFPPADAAMEATLWKSVERLAPLAPRFVSVTYGADGSTRERTHSVVTRIQRETRAHRRAAPDLHRRRARRDSRDRAQLLGRGHPAPGRAARRSAARAGRLLCRIPTGFAYAADLVAGLRALAPFDISVAAYPEVHPEAPSASCGSRESQAQDRCRRVARHHAVLLRHRRVPALSRSLRGAPASMRADRARHSARSRAFRRCCASPHLRREHSRLAAASASRVSMRIRRRAA